MRHRPRPAAACCLALLLLPLVAGAAPGGTRLLDDFETLAGWELVASEGTRLEIFSDAGFRGRGMRLDFDLRGGGYVNVRKAFDLPLPANYVFSFRLRGEAPANGFDFKVIDPTGRNVWWHTDRHLEFPRDWQQVRIRKSRLEFAWGPSGGGEPLPRAGALEFTLTAATGGRGSVWIDDLRLVERDPPDRNEKPAVVTATTEAAGFAAGGVLAGGRGWRSAPAPDAQWLQLDFGHVRELGGLVLSWDEADFATGYGIRSSEDGRRWRDWGPRRRSSGGRDFIAMPDADARFVRIDMAGSSRGRGFGIRAIEVRPFAFSATPNHFFAAVAAEAPRGLYPRYLRSEQTYWVPVGLAGDAHEALLSADGMVEVAEGDFSIEPFVRVDGALLTWAEGDGVPSLLDGFLPVPTVTRSAAGLELSVTAVAAGKPGKAAVWVRYRVRNRGERPLAADLFLALRPFQVNPPWQSLRRPGGFAPIRSVRSADGVIRINDRTAVHLLTPAAAVGATAFADGTLTDALARGSLPPDSTVDDANGHASAAARYELRLAPGSSRDVIVVVPAPGATLDPDDDATPQDRFATRRAAAREDWTRLTGRVQYSIPEPDAHLVRVARSTVAWILVNNDPPAIQPGSRTYARSWIRDGAETTAALVTSGAPADGAAFLRWFAGFQWPSGKIPCCVDARGRDPVPEHDSPGQFLFAVAEHYRYTRDIGLVADLWPNLVAAADYLAGLRAERLTPEFDAPGRRVFRGLLPESISHEGYAAQPMHSYWDDFFAVRGFRDAAFLAGLMGDAVRAQAWRATAEAMAADVAASIALAMQQHGIDHVPGAAELGDFDANSTAIAVAPLGERALLPADALDATFRRYLDHLGERLAGTSEWTNYTPYELRNADALLRLGRPADALRVLRAIVADMRPAAWNQWQEIVWRDAAAPRFIGDMPHTWIGAIFLRTLRSLFAWEDEENDALVLGAGLAPEWIDAGVAVARLPTHHGTLGLDVRRLAPTRVAVRIDGDVQPPAGGLLLRLPIAAPLRRVTVDGRDIAPPDTATARIEHVPSTVLLDYGSGTR